MPSNFFLKLNKLVNSLKEFITNILKVKDPKDICFLLDADGVLYDAERFSHYASYEVLSIFNTLMPSKEDLSNVLVGVKVKDQVEVMKAFFLKEGCSIQFPDDFASLRDARQKELFVELALSPIAGVVDFLETLQEKNITFALVTRSREEPMREKLAITGLDKYFPEDKLFYPTIVKKDIVTDYAIENHISTSLLDVDKTSDFIYAAAVLGFKPNQCYGVEDTLGGVKSILNAGMTAICFTGAPTTNKEHLVKNLPKATNLFILNKM